MQSEILEHIARRFRALGDPTRLAILHALQEGPLSVKSITGAVHGRQANISKHLGILRQAGLVRCQRCGAEVHYEIDDPAVLDLCRLVCTSLEFQATRALEELGQGLQPPPP